MKKSMTERELQDNLMELVEIAGYDEDFYEMFDLWDLTEASATSFKEAGVLTNNKGLVMKLRDGSEFQITIVKSK